MTAVSLVREAGKRILHRSYRYQVGYIHSREWFPDVLNARSLLGEGVEIGTQRGYYSEVLLSKGRGAKLYSIDPWHEFCSDNYVDVANALQRVHDEHYESTVRKLERFGTRSTILRKTSAEAARQFDNGQLDFAYVDGQHHYEAVKEDLALWHAKIRPGGVLAGHDYLDGVIPEGQFGVKSAVDEFARARGLKLTVSREAAWKSWFLFL